MEKSSKRGKIPQQDWPSIIKRYEAGETLASIARTYDCSPPAISYILSRNRTRDAAVQGTGRNGAESLEPRLIKGHANDMPARESINGALESGEGAALSPAVRASYPTEDSGPESVSAEPTSAPNGTARASDIGAEIAVTETPVRPANGNVEALAQAPSPGTGDSPGVLGTAGPQPQPGEVRRRLHLSLSHNDAQPMETPHHDGLADTAAASAARPADDRQQALTQHPARHHPAPNASANNGGGARSMADSHKGRDGGAFIDRALRERVDGDISAFLAAFDAALTEDTIESRAELREATDRLLRAGARTRIELERLEARVPLSARDTTGYSAPNWRPR
jgi:hypothetical protein